MLYPISTISVTNSSTGHFIAKSFDVQVSKFVIEEKLINYERCIGIDVYIGRIHEDSVIELLDVGVTFDIKKVVSTLYKQTQNLRVSKKANHLSDFLRGMNYFRDLLDQRNLLTPKYLKMMNDCIKTLESRLQKH
jgi:hypothetical protein